jgi:asparagine synthetase B (glutamine-hydrolysing)
MENIREFIGSYIKPSLRKRVGVLISGGIDSCIVLHHLRNHIKKGDIYTYTAKFWNRGDTTERASIVAERYGTIHKEVTINDFVPALYNVMKDFPFEEPRYNIWPVWLFLQAKMDGVEVLYTGEGSDENFGGYPDKSFLQGWAGQIIYINSTYEVISKHLDIKYEAPFLSMPWDVSLSKGYFYPPHKIFLREAYKGVLPEIIRKAPGEPPAFTKYFDLWKRELKDYVELPHDNLNIRDIKDALQFLATDAWNVSRKIKLIKSSRGE